MNIRTSLLNKKILRRNSKGFLLPSVIVLAVAISTVTVVGLQSITTSSTTLNDQYYETLANEAAQSGIASAASCAKLGQAWSNATPLRPSTGCDGLQNGTKLDYVAKLDNWESTYEVKAIERAGATSAVFTSVGTVVLKNRLGIVVKDYTRSAKTIAQITGGTSSGGTVSKNVNSLSVGGASVCAAAEGNAYCWGFNGNGQLGNGTRSSADTSKPIAVSKNAVQPVTAVAGYCARTLYGFCIQQINAVGAQTGSALSGKNVTKVSLGSAFTCAIADDEAYCWGDNSTGQLGDGTNESKLLPSKVFNGASSALYNKTVIDIQTGDGFACALTQDHVVACWGNNNYGQLGTNDRIPSKTPVALYDKAEIPASTRIPNPCGGTYQVGFFTFPQPACTPVPVPAIPASPLYGKKIKELAMVSGSDHMCGISEDNDVYCWGRNEGGQIGDRTTHSPESNTTSKYTTGDDCTDGTPAVDRDIDALVPKLVYQGTGSAISGKTIRTLNVIDNRTSAIADDGFIYSWGGGGTSTSEGQCTCNNRVGTNRFHTCRQTFTRSYNLRSTPEGPAYKPGTTTFCWATMSSCPRPTPLDSKQISMFSSTSGAFCSVTGNDIYCDGPVYDKYQGQLGDPAIPVGYRTSQNIFFVQSIPHLVDNSGFLRNKTIQTIDSGYKSVTLDEAFGVFGFFGPNWSAAIDLATASRAFTCVLADQAVACWGINNAGQLGVGDYTSRNVPTPVAIDGPLGQAPGVGGSYGNPVSF